MSTENFSNFNLKTVPLSSDFLVGYDTTAEIRTTVGNLIQVLLPSIQNLLTPVGTVVSWAGTQNLPSGWIWCDGRAVSTVDPTYTNLYNVIGTSFGSSRAGYFNVPDLRGYFVRGWDGIGGTTAYRDLIDGTYSQPKNSRTVTVKTNTPHGFTTNQLVAVTIVAGKADSNTNVTVTVVDNTTFTYQAATAATSKYSGSLYFPFYPRIFGTLQNDDVLPHIHLDSGHTHDSSGTGHIQYTTGSVDSLVSDKQLGVGTYKTGSGYADIQPSQGLETRPKNITLSYIIKY